MEKLHIQKVGTMGYCGAELTKDEHGSIFYYDERELLRRFHGGQDKKLFEDKVCPKCWQIAGVH